MIGAINFTPMDRLNSITAEALQSMTGKTIEIAGMSIERRETAGSPVEVFGYIKTTDGKYYTSISETAIRGIDALMDLMADNDCKPLKVNVRSRTSNNNREFIYLELASK